MIRRNRLTSQIATLLLLLALAGRSYADIYQWEYINPADPSQASSKAQR